MVIDPPTPPAVSRLTPRRGPAMGETPHFSKLWIPRPGLGPQPREPPTPRPGKAKPPRSLEEATPQSLRRGASKAGGRGEAWKRASKAGGPRRTQSKRIETNRGTARNRWRSETPESSGDSGQSNRKLRSWRVREKERTQTSSEKPETM